jgi:glycosyltransferase involved in cell wall biosynthesis
MKNILFVHQSAELYGSDKMALFLVTAMSKRNHTVFVVLPSKGPLFDKLEKENITIIIAPVIKIARNMFTLKNIFSIPFQIFNSFKIIKKQLGDTKIDIVHSNTLAVLIGAFYAKWFGIKHLWHVHEIIEHPKFISDLFPKLVTFFSDVVVFNSKATQDFMIHKYPKLQPKARVVLNGFDSNHIESSKDTFNEFRKRVFNANSDEVVIALVGRISRWKGHQLALDAFSKVVRNYPQCKLVFVGDTPPNQENFLIMVEQKIAEYQLKDKVVLIPFHNEINTIWESIDIAIVPSTEPEPFGLVAIEAMQASKPVIAANHGGLVEIVIPEVTGILFEPNNQEALAHALEELIGDSEKRNRLGKNGSQRAKEYFSLQTHSDNFEKIYQTL